MPQTPASSKIERLQPPRRTDMIARIEKAIETVALLVADGREEFLPIFERLTAELEAAKKTESALERARRIAQEKRAA